LERLESTVLYQRIRNELNRQLVAFFKRTVISDKNTLRIAEVACGSGYASHLLAMEKGVALSIAADINLFDHNQANIDGFKASFILMDIFHPSIQPSSMDLVWNSSSIEEIENPEKAVRSMTRLVRQGGFVFVGVPYKYGIAGYMSRFINRSSRRWLGRVYDQQELRDLLLAADLNIETSFFYLGHIFIGMLGRKC